MFALALSGCAEPVMSGPLPIELDRECFFGGTPCVDGAYCYDMDCNATRGNCVAMPESCSADPDPRCGCDGEVHENACAAAMAGVLVGPGECTAPAGTFGCGDRFCDIANEYCEVIFGGGSADERRCVPLICPAGSSGCECLDAEPSPEDDFFAFQACFMSDDGGTGIQCLRP